MATKSFITYNPSTGNKNATINVTASNSTSAHSTSLSISGKGMTKTVNISQKALSVTLTSATATDIVNELPKSGTKYENNQSLKISQFVSASINIINLTFDDSLVERPISSIGGPAIIDGKAGSNNININIYANRTGNTSANCTFNNGVNINILINVS